MIDDMEYLPGETPLDPDEMAGLRHAHVTTREQLNHLEQANVQEVQRWLARQKSPDLLKDKFLRKLHKRLFGDVWTWAGSYRLTEKNTGVDPLQIGVQLRNLLDDVQYWVDHGTCAPLEAAARFHHRLVAIHPFPNGNGRFARIIADALLVKFYDKDLIDWEGGCDLGDENERRQDYISALRAADGGDYEELLDFVGHTGI